MATAPVVRDLNTIIEELNPATQGIRENFQQQLGNLDTYAAQAREGINAQADQRFGQITQEAQDRKMLFSGVPIHEQSKYTAATLLPALAELERTLAESRTKVMGQEAELDYNIANKAIDMRETDRGQAFDWSKMEAGQEFTTSERLSSQQFQELQQQAQNRFSAQEAEIQRAWQGGENQKARDLELKLQNDRLAVEKQLAALSRASSGGGGGGLTANQIQNQNNKQLSDAIGAATGALNAAGNEDKWIDEREAASAYQRVLQATGGNADLARQAFNQAFAQSGKVKYGNYSF